MGKREALSLLVLVMCYAVVATVGGFEDERRWRGEEEEVEGRRRERGEWFLLQDSKHVIKTHAGDMRVVRGVGGRFVNNPMHIGFITMKPNSLFIPQYLDSSLILFIRRGEARIGSICKDELVEQRLRSGDVYRIEAGSAFYLVNTADSQTLHIVCSIDTSESLNWHAFQSFFVGGGTHPTSILSGFDSHTLSTAFNVSRKELRHIMTRQQSGAIISLSPDSHPPSEWSRFLELEQHERLAHLRRIVHFHKGSNREEGEEEKEEETRSIWSLRKLLISVFGNEYKNRGEESSHSYNLYDRQPDFSNNYGWSLAIDGSDYSQLSRSGIGVYLVNLTAGSMLAPHINPTATEYGIVLRGTGSIQIVYPNGTLAMNAKVREGDVFWVPRYFPFCQIASRNGGPFEFFGFTTSAHRNHPQFLVGANSLLHTMSGPEFAASFGVSEKTFKRVINAQSEQVILPPAGSSVPEDTVPEEESEEMIPVLAKSFGKYMVMGFD